MQERLKEEQAKREKDVEDAKLKADAEREKYAEEVMKPKYREAMELRGPIDEKKWNRIWEKWYGNNKNLIHNHVDNIKEQYSLAQENKERFYTMQYLLSTAALPAQSVIDLFALCINEGVIRHSDVAANAVMK